MKNQVDRQLAESDWSLVLAPAGCGKTHLIANSVKHTNGRQLILTHTHAGVRAMINHLKREEVPAKQYCVGTIDSLALKYACAFPTLSEWYERQPSGDDWQKICSAAISALKRKAVKKVLASSYCGVYVDEYQDCSSDQHELISLIAEYLPCRILGDPMQSIFWEINKTNSLDWENAENTFKTIAELSTPWRWKDSNEPLGQWLLSVRNSLEKGQQIDLRSGPIEWVQSTDHSSKVKACYDALKNKGRTVVAIQKWSNQCHHLARYLNNTFSSMETVECEDLLNYTKRIEETAGTERAAIFIEFTKNCISRLPSSITAMMDRLNQGKSVNPRRPDFRHLANAIQNIIKSDNLTMIQKAITAIENIDERLVFARRELWNEMKNTVKSYDQTECSCLMDRAWNIRDIGRKIGRTVYKKCISTTLLIKGLEFDHAILLNANEMDNAENLYVAMTRGSNSLTVLSENPIIQCNPPRHLS